MSLINWTRPALTSNVNSMWDSFFNNEVGLFNSSEMGSIPAVNVSENEQAYMVELAAPGKTKEDFNVVVENGILRISSEQEERSEVDEKNYTRKEYSFQSFKRAFSIPENVDTDAIDASYKNGLLIIEIPKKKMTKTNSKVVAIS